MLSISFVYFFLTLITCEIAFIIPETYDWDNNQRIDVYYPFSPKNRKAQGTEKLEYGMINEDGEINDQSTFTNDPLYKENLLYKKRAAQNPIKSFQVSPSFYNKLPPTGIMNFGISPYTIVYERGEPVGILQPFPQYFQKKMGNQDYAFSNKLDQSANFNPYFQDMLVDETIDNKLKLENYVNFANEKYADILAKFKIDTRLNWRESVGLNRKLAESETAKQKLNSKRYIFKPTNVVNQQDFITTYTSAQNDNAKYRPQEYFPDSIKTDHKKHISEDNANAVNYKLDNEDENLETGSNKIDMKKQYHEFNIELRTKRNYLQNEAKTKLCDDLGGTKNAKLENKPQNYIDVWENKSRLDKRTAEASYENIDVMKDLEKSGDLTVSGNKSPLILLAVTPKRKINNFSNGRQNELTRTERDLQRKIIRMKENVKSEDGQEQQLLGDNQIKQNLWRKKRQIYSLLNKENISINPNESVDIFLEPHVRKKRKVTASYDTKQNDFKNETNFNAPERIARLAAFNQNNTKVETKINGLKLFSSKRAYREDDDEVDDEGDEFDDDSFDGRTADLMDKRLNYYYSNKNFPLFNQIETHQSYKIPYKRSKPFGKNRKFYIKKGPYSFRVRKSESELKFLGSKSKYSHIRDRRYSKLLNANKIDNMAESDLFGILPQSYVGELSRFKRIKRKSKIPTR